MWYLNMVWFILILKGIGKLLGIIKVDPKKAVGKKKVGD